MTDLPKTQTGYGFQFGSKQIQKYENEPVPKPGSNEVLLKIEAAGMCQSDLHILYAQEKHVPKKFIMGHEIAGQLVQVGENFTNSSVYKLGGRFSLFIAETCGLCEFCRIGKDNMCSGSNHIAYGLSKDGGYQQYLLVKNVRSLIPIKDNISYEVAAVATDSVLTPFHAISKIKHLIKPTSKILVIGLGGLGFNAIQILKHYGCHIVACDIRPESEELALKYGANEFYTDISKSKHSLESFDLAFDIVGRQETFESCEKYIRTNGKIMMIGLGKSKIIFKNYELARREIEVIFSFGGTSQEQIEIMDWISLGKIKPIVKVVDMSELPTYLKKLESGKVNGRVVFRPSRL